MLFVTFEGPEGAGKTTAIMGVFDALIDHGIPAIITREPGSGSFGKKVRELLLDSGEINPRSELFLFLADRANHVDTIVRPALAAGKVVLCDRYADSTVVYQGYARGMDIDNLRALNEMATGGLTPNLTFLLDLAPEIGLARLTKKDRIDSESIEFHQMVRSGFLAEAKLETERWRVLDSTLPAEEIVENILEELLLQKILTSK